MNRKSKTPVLLSNIIQDFFNEHLIKSDLWFGLKLWKEWSEFITSDILKKTKPISYKSGRLLIWVENSVEVQELYFYTEELKQKINFYFKKVWIKDIDFTVNKELLQQRKKSMKLLKQIDLK